MKKDYFNGIYQQHKTGTTIVSLFILLGISLTPYYSVAYLSLVALMATNVRYLPSDFSKFTRYILSLLLFVVYIMIAGVVAWLLHIKAAPFFIVMLSLASHLLINKWTSTKRPSRVDSGLIDKQDLFSFVLAIIAPLIILFSFYFPNFSTSSSIQLITRGYDNIAHLTFLKATSDEGGYVYGTRAETDDRLIHGGGAYPQGWHFATSHFLNGFGGKLFQTTTPLANVNTYVGVLLAWYIITVYLFTRFSLKILRDYSGSLKGFDTYFGNKFGKLEYRSLEFEHETLRENSFQDLPVINYPSEDYPFTRIIEHKKFYDVADNPWTTITREYSKAGGEPYYPVPNPENRNLYAKYQVEAEKLEKNGIYFVGRLASYKYYNMNQAVKAALELYFRLRTRQTSE